MPPNKLTRLCFLFSNSRVLNANVFHSALVPIQELWFIEIDFNRRLMQILGQFNAGQIQEATTSVSVLFSLAPDFYIAFTDAFPL